MSHKASFGITDPRQFFLEIVEPQHRAFKEDRHSARQALLAVIVTYHMREWLPGTFPDSELEAWHRLAGKVANGTKHFKPKANTRRHSGDFSEDFSTDFDASGLKIESDDGSEVYVDDMLARLVSYWRDAVWSS